jgi:hypothetical protein
MGVNMSIEDVISKYENELLGKKGVAGVGVGMCNGKPCIKVYVIKITEELKKDIPTHLDGFLVELEEVGEIRAF